MIKNKNIQVVNENGTTVVLSGAVIVEHLRDYTSDWGSLSTSSAIAETESKFAPVADANIDTFNDKIGFVLPKITLNSLIEQVIDILEREDPEYLTVFQSFNNLEKIAVYFILMINPKPVTEIFTMINNNYKDLSKRDILIRLLSEVELEESAVDAVDPINGLYKLLATTRLHQAKKEPSFKISKGDIEFKEFTFPMHNYNTTKRFTQKEDINKDNDNIRNYYDRFTSTWASNYGLAINKGWFSLNSPLYKTKNYKDIIKDSLFDKLPTTNNSNNKYKRVTNYRDLLSFSHNRISMHSTEEKPLFKYIGENFFDYPGNSAAYIGPFSMNKLATVNQTTGFINRSNLYANLTLYDQASTFPDFKTLLSYYMSDLNMWLTDDASTINTTNSNYLHNNTSNSFLPSDAKSETKGYFSNISFIQNSIQKILFPKILKAAQDGYYSNATDSEIFRVTNKDVYDSIFDSIVNNSFVYTDRNYAGSDIDNNYEIIPNRVESQVFSMADVNVKSNNLYEFIINSIVSSSDNIIGGFDRKITRKEKFTAYGRESLLYKNDPAINYNQIDTKLSSTASSLTLNDFDSNSIVYDFGTNYNPLNKSYYKTILKTFFRMNNVVDYTDNYTKINYRNVKFYKIPVHSTNINHRNKLNRFIIRTDRELLTDISDIANYNITGLSLADFNYGEKSLLKEYINNFRSTKKYTNDRYSDYDIIQLMLTELDYLIDWKQNGIGVGNINNPYYYKSKKADEYFRTISNTTELLKALNELAKTIYFPEILSYDDIDDIKELLDRAHIKIIPNRTYNNNDKFVEEAKELIKHAAVRTSWRNVRGPSNNSKMILKTVSINFMNALRLIVSHIKETSNYNNALDSFKVAYSTGVWGNIEPELIAIRNVLLDDTLINNAIYDNDLYPGYQSGMLRDLDTGLYKLVINNYYSYLLNPLVDAEASLENIVFIDNADIGLIRYYSDIIMLLNFSNAYHEMIPRYVNYLEDNVLDRYYNMIKAVKSLPTWDYESLHRRDTEADLKASGGINSNDYNITWGHGSSNIVMVYKRNGTSESYKVTPTLYKGGLSYTNNDNIFKDRWWKRYVTDGSDAYSYTDVSAFKVPHYDIRDINIDLPETWEYNNPDPDGKRTEFYKMKVNFADYQSGGVASISPFKYITNGNAVYKSIGVPVLLLGDDGSEWNKANTIRENSFSFETDYLNMWHTDNKFDDGNSHNNGGGPAYTWGYQLISNADKYKFGLGNLDIQAMFRHFWEMESSPLANPYNVMAYYPFADWSEGYNISLPNLAWPYGTSYESYHYGFLGLGLGYRNKSNKYDFKFVLPTMTEEGYWSPVRLSGEDRSIGVDPSITNTQIYNNIYWRASKEFYSNTTLKLAVFDVFNRNFRNRVYLSFLKWRYYYNKGAW